MKKREARFGVDSPRYRHGLARSSTYKSWTGMKNRCFNKSCEDYKNYGERGIVVCERWMDFVNFLDDMGEKPPGTSIERVDNNGNYEPGNCVWATKTQQCRNRRYVKLSEAQAEKIRADRKLGLTLKELSIINGISISHVHRIVNFESWQEGC